MLIDKNEIERMEDLSMLSFTESEKESFTKDLEKMVDFINKIKDINLEDKQILNRSVKISDLREDVVKPSMSVEEILKNAPERDVSAFIVPKVVD